LKKWGNAGARFCNGVFRPTIVANGEVIGLWKKATSGRQSVKFDFFNQPDESYTHALIQATQRFDAFLEK
jgi:hypothetical protein